MNTGMNFPCIDNVHSSSTSTEATLLANSNLKAIHADNKLTLSIIYRINIYQVPTVFQTLF